MEDHHFLKVNGSLNRYNSQYVLTKPKDATAETQVAILLRVPWGYFDATVTEGWEATALAIVAKYPHSTLNDTATYSSHIGTT